MSERRGGAANEHRTAPVRESQGLDRGEPGTTFSPREHHSAWEVSDPARLKQEMRNLMFDNPETPEA